MTSIINFLNKLLNPICNVFVRAGGMVIAAMMFLTFFDVGLRYFLSKPIIGSVEAVKLLMALMVAFSISYTALKKGHIRVDLVLTYVPKRVTRILDIFCYGASTILYVLICWQTFLKGSGMYYSKETPMVIPIPIYPFVFFLVLGCILLVLVFLKDTLAAIRGEEMK